VNKLKLVKFIVFLLTFVLIFGIICAASIIYKKVSAKTPALADISLNQPKGSFIENYQFNNDKLYILIKGGGLADRIVILNPERQKPDATIKIF